MRDHVEEFKDQLRMRMREIPKYKVLNGRIFARMLRESVGQAAALIDLPWEDFVLATTNDGVGTKIIVAQHMANRLPDRKRVYFRILGWEVIAVNVNDLAAVGAIPLLLHDEIAVASRGVIEDSEAIGGILEGMKEGCEKEGLFIAGGETAILQNVLISGTFTISGWAIGIVWPKSNVILPKLEEGDIILGFPSSGLQTNGYTPARNIVATRLSNDYLTKLPSGISVGEALLRKSFTYCRIVQVLQNEGVKIHYASHLSGGGWEKIHRSPQEFTYKITNVPEPLEIFRFLQKVGEVSDETAYRTWNMGVGFVIFVAADEAKYARKICARYSIPMFELGCVRRGKRQVILVEKKIIL